MAILPVEYESLTNILSTSHHETSALKRPFRKSIDNKSHWTRDSTFSLLAISSI